MTLTVRLLSMSVPAALTTVVREEGSSVVVELRSEADFSTIPTLSEVLAGALASGAADVVIDLARLEFIDTPSVCSLASAQRTSS
jgi:anti-anti-sigma regulatory factor